MNTNRPKHLAKYKDQVRGICCQSRYNHVKLCTSNGRRTIRFLKLHPVYKTRANTVDDILTVEEKQESQDGDRISVRREHKKKGR